MNSILAMFIVYSLMIIKSPLMMQALKGYLKEYIQICACSETRDPFGLGSVLWDEGNRVPTSQLFSPFHLDTQAAFSPLICWHCGNTSSFFSSHLDVRHDPARVLTSEAQEGCPYLLHEDNEGCMCLLATRRPSVTVATWRPCGLSRAHLGLGGILLPRPSVQLLDTIRRYLKGIDHCQWCGLSHVCVLV